MIRLYKKIAVSDEQPLPDTTDTMSVDVLPILVVHAAGIEMHAPRFACFADEGRGRPKIAIDAWHIGKI